MFVVRDREGWQGGEPLTDETGGAETITINAQGDLPRTTVWESASRLDSAQTDGDFDVVVDVNRNDRYDAGIDVVSGTFPPVRLVLSAGFPTINHNESTTLYAQVQTQEGLPVANGTVNFSITSGRGGQLSSASTTTDVRGMASVTLTTTQPGTTLIIRGTITRSGQTASAEVSVRVRAPGELNVMIR